MELRRLASVCLLTAAALVAGCGDDSGARLFPWTDASRDTGRPGADGGLDAIRGDDGGAPDSMPFEMRPEPFTVIVLPDTQYYALAYPEIFDAQTRWIMEQKMPGRIAFVLHEGDIVDSDVTEQWERASRSLHQLDGVVPYVLAIGNHEYSGGDRSTMASAYFPPAMYAMTPGFGGMFDDQRIDNSYFVFEAGGTRWLVVSLEFGPRDAVVAWADRVVKEHPDHAVIVVTHAYLYSDDTRYDHVNRPDQMWNPHAYPLVPNSNDGEEMWTKLIAPNSNIRFVLSGHVLNDGLGFLTSTRPDGTFVHQILANYQTPIRPLGGGGFLRIMEFFPETRGIRVRTYSPYLNEFLTDPDNDFILMY